MFEDGSSSTITSAGATSAKPPHSPHVHITNFLGSWCDGARCYFEELTRVDLKRHEDKLQQELIEQKLVQEKRREQVKRNHLRMEENRNKMREEVRYNIEAERANAKRASAHVYETIEEENSVVLREKTPQRKDKKRAVSTGWVNKF